MSLILYTKEECPKCDIIKNYIAVELPDEIRADIKVRQIEDPEEYRRELLMSGAYDAVQRTMPVMVDTAIDDVFIGALEIKKHLMDMAKTVAVGY